MQERKFVSITPIKVEGKSGIFLYAIADDGTAWRARQQSGGTTLTDGWTKVPELPKH